MFAVKWLSDRSKVPKNSVFCPHLGLIRDSAPERVDFVSRTDMYHRAKFHADRWHYYIYIFIHHQYGSTVDIRRLNKIYNLTMRNSVLNKAVQTHMQWDTPTDSREKTNTSIAGNVTKSIILHTQESFGWYREISVPDRETAANRYNIRGWHCKHLCNRLNQGLW